MSDISRLIHSYGQECSDEYKKGWQDAVCYINDRHKIIDRANGETMDFVFEININEDELAQKLMKSLGR